MQDSLSIHSGSLSKQSQNGWQVSAPALSHAMGGDGFPIGNNQTRVNGNTGYQWVATVLLLQFYRLFLDQMLQVERISMVCAVEEHSDQRKKQKGCQRLGNGGEQE